MLRTFYLVIFLCYFTNQSYSAEIPSYNCTENKLKPYWCVIFNINLTSTTKNFKLIPHRDVSDITGVSFKNNSKAEILTSDVCDELPKIKNYVAQDLGLIAVEENAFKNCSRLKNVSLENNLLERLPLEIFKHNRELEWVLLNKNKFKRIDMKLFNKNHDLYSLQLDNNQLTEVLSLVNIPNKENLRKIYLQNNQLSDLNTEVILLKCPNLETLWLQDNKFQCDQEREVTEILNERRIHSVYSRNCIEKCYTKDIDDDLSFEINWFSTKSCGDISLAESFGHGDEEKNYQKFPWVAFMHIKGSYSCTANYISRTRAVTVAHCIEKVTHPKQIVMEIFTKRAVSAIDYMRHPNFTRGPKFDIAVIDTDEIYEKMFIPVCLPRDIVNIVGFQGHVLNWVPEHHKAVLNGQSNVVRNQYCKNVDLNVPNHSLCVVNGHEGAILCEKDSGAGFVVLSQNKRSNNNGTDKRYFLHGIVSTGNCTNAEHVILTDVTKFLSFIFN